MRLLSLSARNYRTLHNIDILFSKAYCTISGRNNAGKSSIIRLLLNLFQSREQPPWRWDSFSIDYSEDKTQWDKEEGSIKIVYTLELTRSDDPALINFIEKITGKSVG
jgi:putative ATP-dependent endonuclease of the OLD family